MKILAPMRLSMSTPRTSVSNNGAIARTWPSNLSQIVCMCSSCIARRLRTNSALSLVTTDESMRMLTSTPPTGIPKSWNQLMKREMTAFLNAVAERGCRFQVGTDMLFEQIPAYLDFFGFPSTTPEVLRSLARLDD